MGRGPAFYAAAFTNRVRGSRRVVFYDIPAESGVRLGEALIKAAANH
jgi:hypothetical protein